MPGTAPRTADLESTEFLVTTTPMRLEDARIELVAATTHIMTLDLQSSVWSTLLIIDKILLSLRKDSNFRCLFSSLQN